LITGFFFAAYCSAEAKRVHCRVLGVFLSFLFFSCYVLFSLLRIAVEHEVQIESRDQKRKEKSQPRQSLMQVARYTSFRLLPFISFFSLPPKCFIFVSCFSSPLIFFFFFFFFSVSSSFSSFLQHKRLHLTCVAARKKKTKKIIVEAYLASLQV
jgi:hypothetical protein